uniref:Putative mediator of rna polymerase ii transcription subunit 13 n=1 Tax=Lutzomyia longipalpis TaxID=7200 RepID=A0A1B0CS15_LUTLO
MNFGSSKSFNFDHIRQPNHPHRDNMRMHQTPGRSVALSAEAKEFIPKNKMVNDVSQRRQAPGPHHPHMGGHVYHPQQPPHGQNFHHPPPQHMPSGRQFPASAINHPYMHMQQQQQQQMTFMRHQQPQHMNHPIGMYTEMQLAQQMQRASVQERLNPTRQVIHPMPMHEAPAVQNNFEAPAVQENPPHEETSALDMLSHIIKQLTDQPGMYEEVQVEIKEMFADLMGSRFVMSNAVELIFDHSINESNFRYMGARLCQLLDSLSLQQSNVFRSMLCLKMNHHKMEMERFMLNEQHIVRGTTLFLAELYIQMQNDGSRILEIGECIVSSMALLLNKQGPENVKCVCQSLKLCGYELEIDCGVLLVGITNTLAQLETSVDVSTGRLIRSVLDLKANRWGRTAPIAVAPIQELLHQFRSNDGDELADAEPEMDLEIQLAFREFVQTQKKTSSQNKK